MRGRVAKEDQWPHIPNHIQIEILSRLPIKTLMAFKCVCKSWLNLVSKDTNFAKLHHQRSPTELLLRSSAHDSFSNTLFLGTLQFHNNTVSGFKLSLLFHLQKFSVRSNNYINWKCQHRDETDASFANSCNGLLCFCNLNITSKSHYALICNPVTGEFITVPGAKFDYYSIYLLDFSRKENRYKLLQVIRREEEDPDTGDRSPKLFAEICTFEKGSLWRHLGECPFRIHIGVLSYLPNVFLEGKLHFDPPHDMEEYIDCFDFDNESFGKMPLPPPREYDVTNEDIGTRSCIGVFRGCLSVSRFGRDYCVEIWVMKEYGVEDSWTKAYSVLNNAEIYMSRVHRPLVYLGNDEILMYRADNNLVICNPVLNTTSSLGSGNNCVDVIAYTPSLLPLKGALARYNAQVWNTNSSGTCLMFGRADPAVEVHKNRRWW